MNDNLNKLRAALLLLEQVDFSAFKGGLYDAIPWLALEAAAKGSQPLGEVRGMPYVVLAGDFSSGLHVHGPFPSADDATQWAALNCGTWNVEPLNFLKASDGGEALAARAVNPDHTCAFTYGEHMIRTCAVCGIEGGEA